MISRESLRYGWVHPARLITLLALSLSGAFPNGDAVAGEIQGVVTVTPAPRRQPPPLSPYARTRYTVTAESPMPEEPLIIAVVYLEESPNLKTQIAKPGDNVVDQQNLTIIPHILAIPVGTTVTFRNSDRVHHNLFSLSPARKFDLGRYGKGDSRTVTFDHPGEVRVYCDIHPDMNSVILVCPNKYFTVVLDDGKYAIKDVPPGQYNLIAWNETHGSQTIPVTVPATGAAIMNIDIPKK